MHRNVRALSRGLALDTLREDGYVTFDETNALFGLTAQVRTLSEGVSSRDLSSQAALPAMFSLLDQVSWPSDAVLTSGATW